MGKGDKTKEEDKEETVDGEEGDDKTEEMGRIRRKGEYEDEAKEEGTENMEK